MVPIFIGMATRVVKKAIFLLINFLSDKIYLLYLFHSPFETEFTLFTPFFKNIKTSPIEITVRIFTNECESSSKKGVNQGSNGREG